MLIIFIFVCVSVRAQSLTNFPSLLHSAAPVLKIDKTFNTGIAKFKYSYKLDSISGSLDSLSDSSITSC